MGVNTKKINKMALLRAKKKEYQEFIKSIDLNPIVEYFELGVDAQYFKITHPTIPNKQIILGRNDNLFWGFNSGGYQYTLRRQPLNTSGNNINSIMNELLQKNKLVE